MAEENGPTPPPRRDGAHPATPGPRHKAPGPVDQPPPTTRPTEPPRAPEPPRAAEPPRPAAPRAGTASGPPPRPEIGNRFPAPINEHVEPPRTLRVSRALWLLSFVSGLAAVAFTVLNRTEQHARLLEQVTALDPSRDAGVLEQVATLVFWGTVGALVLVIAIEALLMRSMMRRRSGARVGLFVMVIIHAIVAILAEAFLAAPGAEGGTVRWPLVAQLVLAGAALIAGMLPGAGAWFRSGRQDSAAGRDAF